MCGVVCLLWGLLWFHKYCSRKPALPSPLWNHPLHFPSYGESIYCRRRDKHNHMGQPAEIGYQLLPTNCRKCPPPKMPRKLLWRHKSSKTLEDRQHFWHVMTTERLHHIHLATFPPPSTSPTFPSQTLRHNLVSSVDKNILDLPS